MARLQKAPFRGAMMSTAMFCIALLGCYSAHAVDADDVSHVVPYVLNADYQLVEPGVAPRSLAPHLDLSTTNHDEFRASLWQIRLLPRAVGSVIHTDIASANIELLFPTAGLVSLHWNSGSHGMPSDFQPHVTKLDTNEEHRFESIGGRSSDGVMPYFHLADGHGGFMFAIGWPGDWQCSIARTTNDASPLTKLRITAGLKHSNLRASNRQVLALPSILTMTYQGSPIDGTNQFRRLMLNHLTPKHQSPLDLMPVAASVHGMIGFNDTNEENISDLLKHIALQKLCVDTFWIDAGWNTGGFPGGQGNMGHDSNRFPRGLSEIGKLAKQSQLRFLLWFEPERVMRNTQLQRDRPEWLLSPSRTTEEFRYFENDGFFLLNLANIDARNWMLEHISSQITEWQVDIYRQDANIAPAFFWHTDRAPEDAAILEVEYINGLYQFLDQLQAKHPKLIIDGCAAGGRRLDFESLRRSVMLWRSDSCWDNPEYPRNVQAMAMGLSFWLPLHGLGAASSAAVALRSGTGSCGSFAINYRDVDSIAKLRQHLARYHTVRNLYHEDFYPLTDWTLDSTQPLAYQYHDVSTGSGIVQLFRDANEVAAPFRIKWRGLSEDKMYLVKDWDGGGDRRVTGAQLMIQGLEIPAGKRGAEVVEYSLFGQD
ncbi:alpha-galactosidase [Pirellulaceae bacterium SH449]